MSNMNELDKLNIYASSNLSSDDYDSLSLLYQPLVGSKALGIYLMLYSLIERNSFKSEIYLFSRLSDILGINLDEFDVERRKLEAIGLLETFEKNDSYVLLLKQPLTPNQFLVDSTFGVYLYSRVGEIMYKTIVNHFKIEQFDRKGYLNISASFDEVFKTDVEMDPIPTEGILLGRKPNTSVKILNHDFDFDVFIKDIDTAHLEYGLSEGFKKLIINTSYIYGFDENDLSSLYVQAINKNGYFDSKVFKNKSILLYSYKTNSKAPKLAVKDSVSSDEVEFMNVLANTTTVEILDLYWPNHPSTYLKTINELYDMTSIDRSVLNILLFGILKDKNGELPHINYFKKAINTWLEKGITTKEKAWEYIKRPKVELESKQTIKRTDKTNVKTSDWADENKKNMKEGFEII